VVDVLFFGVGVWVFFWFVGGGGGGGGGGGLFQIVFGVKSGLFIIHFPFGQFEFFVII